MYTRKPYLGGVIRRALARRSRRKFRGLKDGDLDGIVVETNKGLLEDDGACDDDGAQPS